MHYPHDALYGWQARALWLESALQEAIGWARQRGRSAPPLRLFASMRTGFPDCRGLWQGSLRPSEPQQIFLSESLTDEPLLLQVLLHELSHALEPGAHHGPAFLRCMKELGLHRVRGNDTPQPELKDWMAGVIARLGQYPAPAARRTRHRMAWDVYTREVCWCPLCAETGYRTTAATGRADRKSPLGTACPARDPPGPHRAILCATLPLADPYPDLPHADRPDYRIVPIGSPYIQLDPKLKTQRPVHTAWGAFVVHQTQRKPWYRMAGLYDERQRATRLCHHLRGTSARRLQVREVRLYDAHPLLQSPPGTLVTAFDLKTNPLVVLRHRDRDPTDLPQRLASAG